MDSSSYNDAELIVLESWACGVQWMLTSSVYMGYEPPYFGNYTGVV